MSKIDTSPEAIRELIGKPIDQSRYSDWDMEDKLIACLEMLRAIAEEKEATEKSNVEKVAFIRKTLSIGPPVDFEDRRHELDRSITEAKTAPFLDIHRTKREL